MKITSLLLFFIRSLRVVQYSTCKKLYITTAEPIIAMPPVLLRVQIPSSCAFRSVTKQATSGNKSTFTQPTNTNIKRGSSDK